jgi:hypothetical protein
MTKATIATKPFNRYETMTAVTRGEIRLDKGRAAVNDDMKGDDILVEWFDAPKKNAGDSNEDIAHLAHYEATTAAVFNGLDPAIQRLINKPIKEVPEGNAPGQRGTRRKVDEDGTVLSENAAIGTRLYWQQQIGTKVKQWKRSYDTYLNGTKKKGANQNMSGNAPTDTAPAEVVATDITTYTTETLVELIKRLQKAEETPFDAHLVIETCQTALKIVTNKMVLVKK